MAIASAFLLVMSLVGFGRVAEAVGVPTSTFTTATHTGLVISFAGGVIAMVGSLLASREMLAEGPVAAAEAPSARRSPSRPEAPLRYPEPPCRRRRRTAHTWWTRPGLDVRGGRLHVAGRDAETIAREHGTPVYAYDLVRIEEQARALRSAFDGAGLDGRVRLALKAQHEPEVLRFVRALGRPGSRGERRHGRVLARRGGVGARARVA